MMSYKTPLPSILRIALLLPTVQWDVPHHIVGPTIHIAKFDPLPRGMPTSLGTRVYPNICTYFGVIYGKYGLVSITFFFRPDEVMSELAWQSLVLEINKELYNNNLMTSFVNFSIYEQSFASLLTYC